MSITEYCICKIIVQFDHHKIDRGKRLRECKKKVHYPQIQTLDRQTTPDYIYIERKHVNGDLTEYSLMQTSHAKDHLNNTVREQSSIVEDATSPNTSTRSSISHEELRNQVPRISPLGPEHSDPYQSTDPVTSHLEIVISICRGSHNPFYVRSGLFVQYPVSRQNSQED
jgi:hypothetical protein